MKKRITALLLTLVMVLSLFPTTVFATGRGTQIGGKETVLSWRANRRSSESGLQVTVTGSGLSGKELSVDVLKDAEAEKYFNAIESAGNTLVNPMALDIKILNEGAEWQPAGSVQVTITRAGANLSDKVYHFVPLTLAEPIGEDAESADAAAAEELTIEELTSSTSGDTATVDTRHFSVYVIGDEQPHNRMLVKFLGLNGALIDSMYVKDNDDMETVLYEPSFALDSGVIFKGWTTNENYAATDDGMSIADVRTEVAAEVAKGQHADGAERVYYAILVKQYTIKFIDAAGTAIGQDAKVFRADEGTPNKDYTIERGYQTDDTHNFVGWKVVDGSSNVVGGDPTATYPVGTTLTIKGDVTFGVNAPEGHWLVFDENGKGGKYNAPQFVKSGEVTQRPCDDSEMIRNGYTFGGWYLTKAQADAHGENPSVTDGKFTFGQELTDKTTIYASWTAKDSAEYTVIIWKQNLDGDGYDFQEAIRLSGTPNTTINTVSQQGSGDSAYARVNGTNKQYTGFHLKEFDQNVKIAPEGSTVLNVYYDRTEYTLTFQVYDYTYTVSTNDNDNNPAKYGDVDGSKARVYWNNGAFRTSNSRYGTVYTGTVYTRSNNQSWHNVKTITAKYGTSIASNFPIDGYANYVWTSQNSTTFGDLSVVIIEVMPAENVTFRGQDSGTAFRMEYYVQPANLSTNHNDYERVNAITAYGDGWVVTYEEDFMEMVGFSRESSDPAFVDGVISHQGYGTMTVKFYYTRNTYPIVYMDGAYVDGNGNPVADESSRGQLGIKNGIAYQADVSSYNKGGANYFEPTYAGFVFEGWYIDEACTHAYTFGTMPEGGIKVYAKWRQVQYRVFLHPNAGTDPTLDWGSTSQEMNFRVSTGSKISVPTGKREKFKFEGWYTDEALTKMFNADIVLNDTTVTTPYDKTTHMTDPMDQWGNGATSNNDVDRFWITKEFNLYAKWSGKLVGATGVAVQFDPYDDNSDADLISDGKLYSNGAQYNAIAGTTPPTGYKFSHWVMQEYKDGAFVDIAGSKILAGQSFEVNADFARDVETNEYMKDAQGNYLDSNGDIIDQTKPGWEALRVKVHEYTIQLRAVYVVDEEATPTFIHWFINDGAEHAQTDEPYAKNETGANGPLQINEGVSIAAAPTREGYTFLGWARMPEFEGEITLDANGNISNDKIFNYDLTEADLYIKWDGEKYLAKDASGNWTVTATQVAADEKNPYQAFYAVWEGFFYVYHTGSNKVERITLTKSMVDNGYNIINNLTANTLYGGYFASYTGASAPDAVKALTYDDSGIATDTGKTAYAGPDSGTFADAFTVYGDAMKPEVDTVYYVKEVPASSYLRSYFHYTYYTYDNHISSAWLVSNIDDTHFNGVGFQISSPDNKTTATVCRTFTVSTQHGDTTPKKYTSESLFNGAKGYLIYAEVMNGAAGKYGFGDGCSVKQFWVTPDNMMVTGVTQRIFAGVSNADTVSATETDVGSTVTRYAGN